MKLIPITTLLLAGSLTGLTGCGGEVTNPDELPNNPNLELDSDHDGVADSIDAFPNDAAEHLDSDGDGIGNVADTDDDNDGVLDLLDLFPLDPNKSDPTDTDPINTDPTDTDPTDTDPTDTDPTDTDPTDTDPTDTDPTDTGPGEPSVDTDNDGVPDNIDTDDDNDGVSDTQDDFPLDASRSMSEMNKLEFAIQTGNGAVLPQDRALLETRILDVIDAGIQDQQDFSQKIYGNENIEYNPTRNSSYFNAAQLRGSYQLVVGNNGLNLAVATQVDGQNNAAFAYNILASLNEGNNLGYEQAMQNVLGWLLNRNEDELKIAAKVRFVMVDNSTFNKSANWLKAQFPNWEFENCNNEESVLACAQDTDLLITAASTSLADATINALMTEINSKKTPKLYVHVNSWNTASNIDVVMNHFSMGMPVKGSAGNYFSQDSAQWSSFTDMLGEKSDITNIRGLVARLKIDNFDYDLASCEQGYWHEECKNIAEFKEQLDSPASKIRSLLAVLDKSKTDIFKESGYELEKLLVLLGDSYRRDVVFPMDKITTDINEFSRSLFADNTVLNVREYNAVQPDMGNFSRSDFRHITATTKVIDLQSKPNSRAAGVYALPGHTMKVTRLDDSEVNTKIYINSLRTESTLEFKTNGYMRPNYIKSTAVPVATGETIYLTNPYGGPVQVTFDEKDLSVSFRFENIGEHPYWNDESDNESFDAALAKGDYDWAEVATPGFEVHSTLEKMRETMVNPNWNTGALLSEATMEYLHNNPYRLAGFQGPGIKPIAEVNEFSQANNFTIKTLDRVQHMNADMASCGGGCSGNPYDAFWAYNPIGHGDIHELGHGLENNRFKINGSAGHATTNFYSYYSKFKFYETTGQDGQCKDKPFDQMLGLLQESKTEADPFTFMQESIDFSEWNKSPTIIIQLMMAAQKEGSLQEGWNIIPMMHILTREFDTARKLDEAWDAKKDSLGFSQYTREQANAIDNNDYLLIVIGYLSQLDLTDYFSMWGLGTSEEAKSQVVSAGFKTMPTTFYRPEVENGYCHTLDHEAIEI